MLFRSLYFKILVQTTFTKRNASDYIFDRTASENVDLHVAYKDIYLLESSDRSIDRGAANDVLTTAALLACSDTYIPIAMNASF